MNTRITQRFASLALSVLLTAVMLAGIDRLASVDVPDAMLAGARPAVTSAAPV